MAVPVPTSREDLAMPAAASPHRVKKHGSTYTLAGPAFPLFYRFFLAVVFLAPVARALGLGGRTTVLGFELDLRIRGAAPGPAMTALAAASPAIGTRYGLHET